MFARAQVVKWGNGLAMRIPKPVAEQAVFKEGDALVIEVQSQGAVAVRAAKELPTLDELVAAITPENLHREAWTDGPVGAEIW